jgi:hypothetical protein
MALINPKQLQSGSYSISGSFSGSFHGDGSGLTNLPNQSVNTSSFVTTSSFNAFTSSINSFTASYNTGSFTGSFTGSLNGTASYALTASYAMNGGGGGNIDTSSLVTTASFNAFTSSINNFTASYNTGSFTGSFTGSLNGTSSWANNSLTASYITLAQTASYVQNAQTASYVQNAQTASFVTASNVVGTVASASYALTASYVQNAQTASYVLQAVSASYAQTASYVLQAVSSSFASTASYVQNAQTASFAISASYAQNSITASYVQNAQTASYVLQAVSASSSSNTISASYANTASYLTTLSQQIILSGSLKLDPTQDPDPTGSDLDSTVLFQSSSNTALGYDLYIRQNGNLVKWKWIEGILETGLLYGGVVTYSGSNVFVSPGSGIIADHNATTGSEVSPMIEYVTWNAITQSIVNIATQQVTYLYIDNTGSLQQQSTRFTSQQYHDYIPLGAVGHFDYTQVSAFGGGVQTAYDQISQISNFIDAFGPLKMSGYGLTGQVGSLRLSVGSGTSFIHGGFYQNDPEFPSQITTPSQATASLARVQRSGSAIKFDTNAGSLYTVVDPTKYDEIGDGTLSPVGSGNWTIQRVFTDPKTGVLYVYYGQAKYTSLLNALQYLPTDPFTEGDTFDFTTFVGYLVLKGNASDITDTAANSIINGGLFRGSGQGSGGGIALSNLEDLTDVSITSPINGQALIYDDAIWKNGTPLSASYALTASYVQNAQTASYVQNAQTASYVLQAISSSFASTASYVQNSQTASYVQNAQTASYVLQAVSASYVLQAVSSSFASTASFVTASNVVGTVTSASYALTASYAMNGGNINTSSFVTTSSFNSFTSSINNFTSSYNTGSFTGSFYGDGSNLSLAAPTTGVVISFSASYIYNSPTSAGTGSITDNLSGSKLGIVQKIYHNDTSLTVPSLTWVKLGSGTYTPSSLNIIYAEWVSGSRVEYWIVKGS